MVIGTATDEIKHWATALALGSVKLQSSARRSGKLTGLDARDRHPLLHPTPKKKQKKCAPFFLTKVRIAFGQNWKLHEFGGFVFLIKIHSCFEKHKPFLHSET